MIRNSHTTLLSLHCFALWFSASILFKVSDAEAQRTDIFTTKSGRKIPLKFIRPFIPSANESHLKYLIFEYDAASNLLFSFHRTMSLPDKSTRSRINLRPDIKHYFHTELTRDVTAEDESNVFKSKSKNGDTFLFDAKRKFSLIGAFGDALDLHPINDSSHEVFLNHYRPAQVSNMDTYINAPSKPKVCKNTYELSLHVITDHLISSRFGGGHSPIFYMIEQFITQNVKLFMDLACVDIHLMGITSYSSLTFDINFDKNCHSDSGTGKCGAPLPRFIMSEMKNYPLYYEGERELYLFISGLNNPGSLAGLTYKSRACEVKLSNIWIKGLSKVALYHEIGHLLGANHALGGIMQPNVLIKDGICFSKKSQDEIIRFVEKDSRSWCLRRKYSRAQADILEDGWVNQKLLLADRTQVPSLAFESISIASLSSVRRNDLLFLMFGSDETRPIEKSKTLFYGSVENILSISQLPSREKIEYKSLGLEFSRHHNRFNLQFFTLNSYESKGVILSYFDYSQDEEGKQNITGTKPKPYYRVGSVKRNGEIDVNSWSKERAFGTVDLVYPDQYGVSIAVDVGNIRNEQSVDLLYMQLKTDKTTNEWKTSLKYKIGFNMSKAGIIQSGWSEYFTILGEFGTARSISGSIIDVDGNGKLDLVVYVVEFWFSGRAIHNSYFRVGKDLSSEGIVEGGWTEHRMTPSMENVIFGQRTMDVGKDSNSGQLVLISAQRLLSENRNITNLLDREVVLSFSHKNLFNKVMKTVKKYSAIESVEENCEFCFPYGSRKQCQDKLSLCKSQIDLLQIFQHESREDVSNGTRMEIDHGNFRQSGTHVLGSKSRSLELFSKLKSRDYLNINSIYCTGFKYFLSQVELCDTIDAKAVYSKGLEITFTRYLTESILEKDISSNSLFEDTLGTHNNGKPIIVQAEIHGRQAPTNYKIKRALRRALAKKQIPSKKTYDDLITGTRRKLFTTKKRWDEKRKIWRITFTLSATGLNVF